VFGVVEEVVYGNESGIRGIVVVSVSKDVTKMRDFFRVGDESDCGMGHDEVVIAQYVAQHTH
jgi:hypothetical protein